MFHRRIFHVDLDAFFVEVERALDPSLRGRPVVVGGEPGTRGVVACASYEARAYGLRAGMSLTMAQALCPRAVFLSGRFQHYQEASERFLACCRDLTPEVEPSGIDEAYLDLTGFEPLYGPPRDTALRLKEAIRRETGVTASVGIASNKVVAKVASDLSKPDGLVEVPPGQERAFLAPLPVRRLPTVGPQAEATLKRIGITTIGELAALPPPLLRRLFGALGEVMHRFANGRDDRPLAPPVSAKSVSRSTTFPRDSRDRAFLEAILRYLAERVGAVLREEGKKAQGVALTVRYANFSQLSRQVRLPQPSDGDDVLFQAGLALLGRALALVQLPVRLLGFGAFNLVPAPGQLALFSPDCPSLYPALDRLRQRHGFTALQTGRTFLLRSSYPVDRGDYMLKTSCLSR